MCDFFIILCCYENIMLRNLSISSTIFNICFCSSVKSESESESVELSPSS